MQHEAQSYVYLISRTDGTPCYVGKGKGERWRSHGKRTHNPHLARIYAKYGELPVVKLRDGLTDAEAMAFEIQMIAAIGRLKNGGPLVNMTDGGEGVVGHVRTDAQRTAMSKARKGKPVSPDAGKKISAALKGRPKSPEHCAAVSAAKKGVSHGPLSKAHCAAIGEARAAMRAGQAKVDAAEKSRKITKALTGKKLSKAHRQKISQVQRGRTRSPEFRAKVSAAMKARYAERRALGYAR